MARTTTTAKRATPARRGGTDVMQWFQSTGMCVQNLIAQVRTAPGVSQEERDTAIASITKTMSSIGQMIGGNAFASVSSTGGAISQTPARTVSTRTPRGARTATTTRKRTTIAKLSKRSQALLSYFEQHPTATYTSKQLMQVSPFSGWKNEQSIARTATGLIKMGRLIKDGAGFTLMRQAIAA